MLICANPFSGSGPNRRHMEGLVEALSARGLEPRLVWDIQQRQATLADPQLAAWCRCVVVAGGDGSIGAVINEMDRAGVLTTAGDGRPAVALATLPMGNENLFAKYFGFTRDTRALSESIGAGRTRRIDLGRAGSQGSDSPGHLFTLMASIGFDAEVVHRMDRWRSTHHGLRRVRRISYLPRVVSSAWGYRCPGLRVQVDGQALTGSHLFVFNLPSYGGGLNIAPPGCREDDGLLDWVMFDRPGVWPLLGYAWSVLRGRHLDRSDVMHGRASRLTVCSQAKAPLQLDGDPAGTVPAEVQIDDRARLDLLIT